MTGRIRNAEERLATEVTHATSRGAFAGVVAIAVALVVAANLVAGAVTNPPWTSPDRRIIGTKLDIARDARSPDADVLVLGDSSAAFGISAEELGARLGVPVRNLATFGRFEIAGSAWMLDEYLRHHRPPRLVVALHGARTWWMRASGIDLAQLELGFAYWRERPPRREVTWSELGEYLLARYVPLYTQSSTFARAARGGGLAVPDRPPIAPDGTMLLGVESYRWSNPQAFLDRTIRPELEMLELRVPESQRRASEVLARRAEEVGFDLVFVSGPEWDALAREPKHAAFVAEVERFLAELTEGSERARLLPGGPAYFPTDKVENPYHLIDEAALEFTRALAGALQGLGLPR